MFALPSLWNLVISTLVFILAARQCKVYLEDQGIQGLTRSTLVFTLASLISCGSGEIVDWSQEKIQGKPPQGAETSDDLSAILQLLKPAPPSEKRH